MTGNGLGLSIDRPAGVALGDTMFVYIQAPAGHTITPPSGWTLVTDGTNDATVTTGFSAFVFTKAYEAGDPASYAFTCPDWIAYAAVLMAFSHVSAIQQVATGENPFDTAGPSLTVTTAGSSSALLYFWGMNYDATGTAPTGMTLPSAIATGGASSGIYESGFGAYALGVAAGSNTMQGGLTGASPVLAIAIAFN
jgi:hypothetical protein